jgi:putative transposase
MPNHWHLVLWPQGDGDLSALLFWLTMTHTQRWRHFRRNVGEGPLYQSLP